MATAADGPWFAIAAPEDALRRARTWLLVAGIVSILAGITAIVVPAAASVAIAILIGWILVFAGIAMFFNAFSRGEPLAMALRVLTAVLTVFVGVYLLVAPLDGTVTLTFILAVWFFGVGLLQLMAAWQQRGLPGAGFVGLNGALSVILGLLIAVGLPSSANWAIGLLVGINLVLWGVRALVLASLIKRAIEPDGTARAPSARPA